MANFDNMERALVSMAGTDSESTTASMASNIEDIDILVAAIKDLCTSMDTSLKALLAK